MFVFNNVWWFTQTLNLLIPRTIFNAFFHYFKYFIPSHLFNSIFNIDIFVSIILFFSLSLFSFSLIFDDWFTLCLKNFFSTFTNNFVAWWARAMLSLMFAVDMFFRYISSSFQNFGTYRYPRKNSNLFVRTGVPFIEF